MQQGQRSLGSGGSSCATGACISPSQAPGSPPWRPFWLWEALGCSVELAPGSFRRQTRPRFKGSERSMQAIGIGRERDGRDLAPAWNGMRALTPWRLRSAPRALQ